MYLDRFVMSLDSGLAEADLNALPNSDTDAVQQGAHDNFIAFEAEHVVSIANDSRSLDPKNGS
jgi:hypothetical protein